MICGNAAATSELFREIADAFVELGRPDVLFNAHDSSEQVSGTVWNAENVPEQVTTDSFPGCEVWDMSARNVERWRAAGREVTHVPVGWHRSMERFVMRPWEERDIDVVFMGCVNDRRRAILEVLAARGREVLVIPPGVYGAPRDAMLARAKLCIAPLYYPEGIYGTLRAAHCAANGLPLLSEVAVDMPKWLGPAVKYDDLVDAAVALLRDPARLQDLGPETRDRFKDCPLVLPERQDDVAKPDPWASLKASAANVSGVYPPDKPGVTVHMAVPLYREPWAVAHKVLGGLERVCHDLEEHGIGYERTTIEGDSLVCRMRQRVCHEFLLSGASHLLFCDGDIEPLNPDCVRRMLASGHDVVAGAAPFKETTGRVVVNPIPGSLEEGQLRLEHGCIEVQDAGTGFMLVSRRILLRLMEAHPELLHWTPEGKPLWALFDTRVDGGVYLSEDFSFCRYVQALGEKVYVYVPATFRHYGVHGFEGSFETWYGLQRSA